MRRNPLYVFKDQLSTGIVDVPLKSMVHIIDADALGHPRFVQIIAKTGLNNSSIIAEFLADETLYIEANPIDKSEVIHSDGSINMINNYTPIDNLDVTTKIYVDARDIDGGTF